MRDIKDVARSPGRGRRPRVKGKRDGRGVAVHQCDDLAKLPAIAADCAVNLAPGLIDIIAVIVIPEFLNIAIDRNRGTSRESLTIQNR